MAYNSALTKDLTNGKGDLTKPTLDEEINNEFGSSGKVEQDGDYWVIYVDNNEIEKISIPESALAPTIISQGAKVGDYVNYNASSGNGINLQLTSTDMAAIVQTIDNTNKDTKNAGGATISGTFTSNDITKWRIISIEGETIKLIAVLPTTQSVTLQGTEGFRKCKQILDSISEIYGKGNGAIEAKSVTMNDFNFNYSNNNLNGVSSDAQEYTTGYFFKQILNGGNITGYENNLTEATVNQTITIRGHMCYSMGGPNMFKDMDNSDIMWDLYSNTTYGFRQFWFASQGVAPKSYGAEYTIQYSDSPGGLVYCKIADSSMPDYANDPPYGTAFVKPVVTLKAGIRGEKAQDGSWNLDV